MKAISGIRRHARCEGCPEVRDQKVCEKGGEIVTLCAFDRDLFVTYDAVPGWRT